MTPDQKNQIKELFFAKCERMGLSQNKAAIAAGTKATTISQVFSGTYGANDEQVYRLLAAWVDAANHEWKEALTKNHVGITSILEDAQQNSNVYALIGRAGTGKTFTFKKYTTTHKSAFLLCCNEFWNRKLFLRELLTAMGKESGGLTVGELMETAISALVSHPTPILILDEADKLSDQVLYFFITLYNRLEDRCGIILAATEHLEARLRKGVANNRKGYTEIWSRIGRKPIKCENIKAKDIKAICIANGIEDEQSIRLIVEESEGDLRRVKKSIHRTKKEAQ